MSSSFIARLRLCSSRIALRSSSCASANGDLSILSSNASFATTSSADRNPHWESVSGGSTRNVLTALGTYSSTFSDMCFAFLLWCMSAPCAPRMRGVPVIAQAAGFQFERSSVRHSRAPSDVLCHAKTLFEDEALRRRFAHATAILSALAARQRSSNLSASRCASMPTIGSSTIGTRTPVSVTTHPSKRHQCQPAGSEGIVGCLQVLCPGARAFNVVTDEMQKTPTVFLTLGFLPFPLTSERAGGLWRGVPIQRTTWLDVYVYLWEGRSASHLHFCSVHFWPFCVTGVCFRWGVLRNLSLWEGRYRRCRGDSQRHARHVACASAIAACAQPR